MELHSLTRFAVAGALLLVLLVTGCDVFDAEPSGPGPQAAPPHSSAERAARTRGGAPTIEGRDDIVPGRYIVTLHEEPAAKTGGRLTARAEAALERVAAAPGIGARRHTYTAALVGFSAELSPAAVEALRRDPAVKKVEPVRYVYAVGTHANPRPWGLDRVDQAALPLDRSYTFAQRGAGVTAYVIDTGILTDHVEFGGRASVATDANGVVDFAADQYAGDGRDHNGHGTHVAGTIGGATVGIVKDVRFVAVRVLDWLGRGTTDGVIAGVDWVTQDVQANDGLPAVANMSLGGKASNALDAAVRNSIAAGVTYVLAAGNDNRDACRYSPARVSEAVTVGATDAGDRRASFSNYGACLDLFAPGVGVLSASTWGGDDAVNYYIDPDPTAYEAMSGTSMAAPHAAGVAALYLQAYPAASPQEVRDALVASSSLGVVQNASSANNHLVFSRAWSGEGAGSAPGVSFTSECAELSCAFTGASVSATDWWWSFGDYYHAYEGGGSGAASHTYGRAQTYTAHLTVRDASGSLATFEGAVVPEGGGASETTYVLSATPKKRQGWREADLSWTPNLGANPGGNALAPEVDVYRITPWDGQTSLVATTENDGAYTDRTPWTGSFTVSYRVCEAGTENCSDTVPVTF